MATHSPVMHSPQTPLPRPRLPPKVNSTPYKLCSELPPEMTLSAIITWDTDSVCQWLRSKNMEHCIPSFCEHEIIGEHLLELTPLLLRELCPAVADRIRLEHTIVILRYELCLKNYPALVPSATSTACLSMGSIASPVGGNTSDSAMPNCIKITGNPNETRMVDVSKTSSYEEIMKVVFKKFNIPPAYINRFSLFANISGSTRALSESELVAICQDPTRPEREKLFLRRTHIPFSFTKPSSESSFYDPKLDPPISPQDWPNVVILPVLGPSSPTFQDKPKAITSNFATSSATTAETPTDALQSKISLFLPLQNITGPNVLKVSSLDRQKPNSKNSLSRLRRLPLPAHRPPSEVISSNLTDYFPTKGYRSLGRGISSSNTLSRSNAIINRQPIDAPALPPKGEPCSRKPLTTSEAQKTTSSYLTPPASALLSTHGPETNIHNHDTISRHIIDCEFSPETPEFSSTGAPNNWMRGIRIGNGSFGSVYLALNQTSGGLMAVKQVELSNSSFLDGDVNKVSNTASVGNSPTMKPMGAGKLSIKHRMVIAMQQEISLLRELEHPNIVKYLGTSFEKGTFNIFLEYIPGGSISYNLQLWGVFPEPMCKSYLRQVLIGIVYLHQQEIIHRDIKAANMLLDNNGKVKITDFGISKRIFRDEARATDFQRRGSTSSRRHVNVKRRVSSRDTLQGTPYWMSPEIIKEQLYSTKSDIWAFGCLAIEMLTANHPYPTTTPIEAIYKIGHGQLPGIPVQASEKMAEFLNLIFKLKFSERPEASELLQHKFLEE